MSDQPGRAGEGSVQDLAEGAEQDGDVALAGGVAHAADAPHLTGDRAEPSPDLDAVVVEQEATTASRGRVSGA